MARGTMLAYWDGDSWENVVSTGTISAVYSLDIVHEINLPKVAFVSIINKTTNPYSGSAGSAKGAYTGVFTDFMPVRLTSLETNDIMLYGVVYQVKEKFDERYGMVIELECRDFLTELKDNLSHGATSYKIDVTVAGGSHVTNFLESTKATSASGQVWGTSVSSRGGLIKSLINQFTSNLDTSDSDKCRSSVINFYADGTYNLGSLNKKSILSHIADLAASEPHAAVGEEQFYGFDFYVDPNFVSTGNTKPTADFNYFKAGTRPNTDPANYGLTIQQPGSTGASSGGRTLNMLNYRFDRPKSELYTEVVLEFLATLEDKTVRHEVIFEALKVKAVSDGSEITKLNEASNITDSVLKFDVDGSHGIVAGDTIKIDDEQMHVKVVSTNELEVVRGVNGTAAAAHNDNASVTAGFTWGARNTQIKGGTDAITMPEMLQCRLDGSGDPNGGTGASGGTLTDVARMQYINKTKGTIDTDNIAYVLISDVNQGLNDSVFGENVIWYGKQNTSASFTIKSRPRNAFNFRRTNHIVTPVSDPNTLREMVASSLIKSTNSTIRGSFTTYSQPISYFDNSPSAINSTSSTTQTYTLANVGTTAQLTTLGAAITSLTATTLTVASSSGMAAGQTIKIDSEEMTISSVVASTTIVVVRAVNQDLAGGVAATHSNSAAIYNVSGNPLNNGVRVGTAITELDANSQPTATYGYCSAVSATQVTVTWATGTVATDSTIRYYIPVRAGDVIKVTNNLANVDQIFTVIKVSYAEQSGLRYTRWEVQGRAKADEAAHSRKTAEVATQEMLAYIHGMPSATVAGNVIDAGTNLTVRPTDDDAVAWGTGTYNASTKRFPSNGSITIGDRTLTIEQGTTNHASFMIDEYHGNPGQGDLTGSTSPEFLDNEPYYIYYPGGTGTSLHAIMKKNYVNVQTSDSFVVFEAIKADPLATYSWHIEEPVETTTITGTILGAQMQESTAVFTDSGDAVGDGTTETFKVISSDGGVYLKLRGFNDYAQIDMATNSGSGAMILRPHASVSGTYTFTFPNGPSGTDNHVLTSDGTAGLTDWASTSSSERYKENIRGMELDSSKIYDLTPKSFDYIDGHVSLLGGTTFGYIAEEVEKVLPEVIQYNKEGQPDSLHYQLLTVLLVEEIKKLKTRLENLESEDNEEKA
jgi:hypothetical protein